jgi:hypothetical protein
MCGNVGGYNIADPLDFSGAKKGKEAKAAEARAAAAEAARQARISGNVRDINSAFSGRMPQYEKFGTALRERLNGVLGKQQQDATRQSKFALARGGLTGGSAAIDAGRNLTREAQEGALKVEQQARGGVADLMSKDEQARTQMISLAQSGNDIGNAASQTAASLRANLQGAESADLINGLGDVFGNTAKTYRAQQDAAARRRGLSEASTYAKAFSRG